MKKNALQNDIFVNTVSKCLNNIDFYDKSISALRIYVK